MRAARVFAGVGCLGGAIALGIACDGGQPRSPTAEEPLAVRGGQFFSGDLPGTPPTDAGPATGDDGGPPASTAPLSVTLIQPASQLVIPGAIKSFGGRLTDDAVAVGVRFTDMGTGYWVSPVSVPDPQYPGEITFAFTAEFNAGDAPGNHPLRFVAIGPDGKAGTQADTSLCVESRVPDNLHSCDPTLPAPAVVFSLQWDADFDLDLHVVTPDGLDVNPKRQPVDALLDAGQQPDPSTPHIDRDSLGQCVPDGFRQEDLVFPQYPATGAYDVYADPFDACGRPAVRFTLTVYEKGDDGNLHATFSRSGELLQSQVTGGASTGLFVAEKQFN